MRSLLSVSRIHDSHTWTDKVDYQGPRNQQSTVAACSHLATFVIRQLDSKILHIQGELSSREAEMVRARPMRCRASSSLGIRPGEVFHVELLDAEGGSGGQGGGVDMR